MANAIKPLPKARLRNKPFPTFSSTAMGKLLAQQSIGLVYSGGKVGLMGTVADAALTVGGEVIGIILQALSRSRNFS
jgi:predicted Rossmann-fold nucleotide-binding protein